MKPYRLQVILMFAFIGPMLVAIGFALVVALLRGL